MSRRVVPAFASTPIPHRVPSLSRARRRRRKLESASQRRRHRPERVYPQPSTMESANLDTYRPGTNRGSVVRVVVQRLEGSQIYLETNGTSLFIRPMQTGTRRSLLGRAGGDCPRLRAEHHPAITGSARAWATCCRRRLAGSQVGATIASRVFLSESTSTDTSASCMLVQ
jgi:hypothetical protein